MDFSTHGEIVVAFNVGDLKYVIGSVDTETAMLVQPRPVGTVNIRSLRTNELYCVPIHTVKQADKVGICPKCNSMDVSCKSVFHLNFKLLPSKVTFECNTCYQSSDIKDQKFLSSLNLQPSHAYKKNY